MDKPLSLSLLENLCAATGASGFEAPVAQALADFLDGQGVACKLDRVGNLVAHLAGDGPRVLLVAHMDEVGFIVRKVEANGFLRLERVGGSAVQAAPGQYLTFSGERGPVAGVVGMLPPHLQAQGTPEGLAGMYVDIGAGCSAQVQEMGILVGTPAVYAPRFQVMQNCVAAKALDDRAGCALLAQLAGMLAGQELPCDLTLAFVVQEENVLTGARPVADDHQPDWVLGVDATLTYDTPELTSAYADLSLGLGPAIKIMDHIRGRGQGLIAHPALRRHIEDTARQAGIALQREVAVGISTAVAPLPFSSAGIPTAAISFPLRYSHSPAEVASLDDLNQTLHLLHRIVMDPWVG
jgi:putative aminopeptidase FrvX